MKLRLIPIVVLVVVALAACRGMSGESTVITDDIPVDANAELQIDNVTGSIQIAGANRTSIDLSATVTDAGLTAPRNYVDIYDVTIDVSTDGPVRIAHSPFDAGNISVDYELYVPDDMTIDFVETITGAIVILDAPAIRHLETVTGSIEAELLGVPADGSPVVIETTTGSILVAIDPSLALSVSAHTVTGSVTVAPGLGASGGGGSWTLNGGGRQVTISATTGSIQLVAAH